MTVLRIQENTGLKTGPSTGSEIEGVKAGLQLIPAGSGPFCVVVPCKAVQLHPLWHFVRRDPQVCFVQEEFDQQSARHEAADMGPPGNASHGAICLKSCNDLIPPGNGVDKGKLSPADKFAVLRKISWSLTLPTTSA